jgi:hypothetical protein
LRRRELGLRLRVVGFLLADRMALGERREPRRFAIVPRFLRLRARKIGLRGGGLRLERLRIDDEQRLARLHPRAFVEQAPLEDAAHTSAHLDFLRARRLTDVLEHDRDRRRLQLLHDDLRRRHSLHAAPRRRRFAARGCDSGEPDDHSPARNRAPRRERHQHT